MTKKELKNIPYLEIRINSKLRQLDNLKEQSTCIGSMEMKERVQSSNKPDSTKIIDDIADLSKEINDDIDCLVNLKRAARELFKGLEGREQALMELRYLEGKTWGEISSILGNEMRYILKIHGNILKKTLKDT